MADIEYMRLTRSRPRRGSFFSGLATSSSLWLGKDHLLNIDSNRFSEQYKRFYFRDIQAIATVRNKRREAWNILLTLFVLSSLLFVVAGTPRVAGAWALIFLIMLLVNNVLGP